MAEDIMIYINCQAEDRDICTSYPDLFFSTSPSLPPVQVIYDPHSRKESYDTFSSQRDEDSKENIFQQPESYSPLSTSDFIKDHEKSSKRSFKNKKICKRPQQYSKSNKNDDRKLSSKNSYPTKNFLPNFKGPHLQFLEKQLGKHVLSKDPFISELKAKNGISMQDYQRLYQTPEYTKTFQLMFKTRLLYRQLLLSRCNKETRIIHQQKIYVFERAFYEQKFERIN